LTTFENLQDALTAAFLPIGRGILDILSSTEGGSMRVIDMITNMALQIGEVFSAIGKSGVIQDFITRITSTFGPGGNFQQAMINTTANLLAFFAQLPRVLQEIGPAFVKFFDDIGYNIKAFFSNTFGGIKSQLDEVVQNIRDRIFGLLRYFSQIKVLGVPVADTPLSKLFKTTEDDTLQKQARKNMPYRMPSFPMPAASMIPNLAGAYGDAIRSMLGPQGLPSGMIFGGAQGTSGMGGDSITGMLGKIADNTKTTADALTLRRETLGGGQLGQMGVTAAELAVGGGGGIRMGDFMGGGNRGLIPAGTELERAVRSVIRDEARRNGTPGIMKRF
jgi:hypothetical protein